MEAVAIKPDSEVVLPVTKEWRDRVNAELDKMPRGARAQLADAIGCSSGQLSDLLADDDPNAPTQRRYSKYVEPVNQYFKWPSMMPLSPDSAELRHLLEGLSPKSVELIKLLEDQPDEIVDAMLLLVQRREKNSRDE